MDRAESYEKVVAIAQEPVDARTDWDRLVASLRASGAETVDATEADAIGYYVTGWPDTIRSRSRLHADGRVMTARNPMIEFLEGDLLRAGEAYVAGVVALYGRTCQFA